MSERKVRVRFAPSPTGPLHMGGVRTALYNYLFAKKNGGDFILRIEDTDQTRFVPGAETYIIESLKWCGIEPNEGVGFGDGVYRPYRQSERKPMYREYAEQLVKNGNAYYAFDSSEELEAALLRMKKTGETFSYNAITRQHMKNSLSLSENEVQKRISAGEHYVVRIKIPSSEEIRLHDNIRGWVVVHSSQMDDKVLLKSDGMPTYHLANVVDDYLMRITHVIRGEEWLPSAPLHVLLYRYLGWENVMPEFAHLPLLLRPDGNGKLSKRDGDRLGFPVFPLSGEMPDPKTGMLERFSGYREAGYFPEAFINILAMLGWNPGTEQEIFTMDELIRAFSFEHIHKAGARFNPEKAKWFNQQYLRVRSDEELAKEFLNSEPGIQTQDFEYVKIVCSLVKEKATFVSDFWSLSSCIFIAPLEYDNEVIRKRWNEKTKCFIEELSKAYRSAESINENTEKMVLSSDINANKYAIAVFESIIQSTCGKLEMKQGEVMQLIRVLISGKGSGVDLLGMMALVGRDEVCNRLEKGIKVVSDLFSKQITK